MDQQKKSAYGQQYQKTHMKSLAVWFKAEVRENISTSEGKKLIILRDIQSEGTFGNIKSNWKYDR